MISYLENETLNYTPILHLHYMLQDRKGGVDHRLQRRIVNKRKGRNGLNSAHPCDMYIAKRKNNVGKFQPSNRNNIW